jgi:hypothetical protein
MCVVRVSRWLLLNYHCEQKEHPTILKLLSEVLHIHTVMDELIHQVSFLGHIDSLDAFICGHNYPQWAFILPSLAHNLVGKYMHGELNSYIVDIQNHCSSRSFVDTILLVHLLLRGILFLRYVNGYSPILGRLETWCMVLMLTWYMWYSYRNPPCNRLSKNLIHALMFDLCSKCGRSKNANIHDL